VDLRPIPSIWGHAAGGGASAADRAFLSEQIARALDMVEAALGIE
jgi:hypothetical protein